MFSYQYFVSTYPIFHECLHFTQLTLARMAYMQTEKLNSRCLSHPNSERTLKWSPWWITTLCMVTIFFLHLQDAWVWFRLKPDFQRQLSERNLLWNAHIHNRHTPHHNCSTERFVLIHLTPTEVESLSQIKCQKQNCILYFNKSTFKSGDVTPL
jgi:hypothetical protein